MRLELPEATWVEAFGTSTRTLPIAHHGQFMGQAQLMLEEAKWASFVATNACNTSEVRKIASQDRDRFLEEARAYGKRARVAWDEIMKSQPINPWWRKTV